MYGKFFSSTFTGSMFGAGPDVFAVWGYIIANTVESTIELNPAMLAAIIGSSPANITAAIDYLCQPDSKSRNKEHDGRRLLHEANFQYHVVSHALYRAMRNEEERRAYNRIKQQESRARRKPPAEEGVTPIRRRRPARVSASLGVNGVGNFSPEAIAERERLDAINAATAREILESISPQRRLALTGAAAL